MRLPVLILTLLLTFLPECFPCVNTSSYGLEVCIEDVCDVEEEAVIRTPQRISEKVRTSSEILSAKRKFVVIPVHQHYPIQLCFERLWISACTLRL